MLSFSKHVVEPKGSHEYTMILLAGRGSEADEYAEELADAKDTSDKSIMDFFERGNCRYVVLGAPVRETMFGPQPEWFDLASTSTVDSEEERQLQGLMESVEYMRSVIEEELKSVPAKRMVIGGNSQGMAVSSLVLLSSEHTFGAYLGSCGWIVLRQQMLDVAAGHCLLADVLRGRLQLALEQPTPVNATPVFITNNKDDPVIDSTYGEEAAKILSDIGMRVEFRQYEEGGHEVNEPKGWDAIQDFLRQELE